MPASLKTANRHLDCRFIAPLIAAVIVAGCNGPAKQVARQKLPAMSPGSAAELKPVAEVELSHVQLAEFLDEQKGDGKISPKESPKESASQPPESAKKPDEGLTLPQLLVMAANNNPELAAARTKAAAHGWKVPQVTSLDDPMLSSTVFLDAIETAGGSQDVIVSLSQKLPWLGKLKLRGQIANAQAESLCYEAERIRLEIAEQTRHAYYDFAYFSNAHKALKTLEPKITSVVNTTRAKFRTEMDETKRIGYETVLQAEVELYRLRTQLAEIEEAQKRVLSRLKELINHPQDQPLVVNVTETSPNVPANLTPLLDLVDQCQPELLARMWESQRDAAGMKLARKNYYPDFTVGANWYGISNSGISPVANGNDAASLMFGINVPIYRKRLKAADSEARLKYYTSRHKEQSTANRFRAEVSALHADAVAADRVLKILEENVIKRARRTLDLSLQSWRQDRIEFQRVIDNYQSLVRFEIAILERKRAVNKTLASLERAVGCAAESWSLK